MTLTAITEITTGDLPIAITPIGIIINHYTIARNTDTGITVWYPSFSFSIGTNWDWTSYDSYYSNYYDTGLNWGISYASDDYSVYISSGNTTYVSTYQVWIPGHWETVYDRVTDIGLNGVVCWRYKSHQVWKPGYWEVRYR